MSPQQPSQPPGAPPQRRRTAGAHRSAAVIGVLTLLLGFAIAVQVRANSTTDALSSLREDDLITILDNQNDRADRLRLQIATLQQDLRQLENTGDSARAARAQAAAQEQALGVLLGTLPAAGPGVTVVVADPTMALNGENLLDVIEELRGAGAEAMQAGPVRISTSTSFTGSAGHVEVDGVPVTAPYVIRAIGDPTTLDAALNIPGGVAATIRSAGGDLTVHQDRTMTITAVRALPAAKYAKPTR